MNLVLASGSPRRRQLLENLGLAFDVRPTSVDESRYEGEPPAAYVERVAKDKAQAAAGPGRVVVGCDTVVVHEGRVLGKPVHPEEARSMLRRLAGEVHEVFTGVAVVGWEDAPVVRSAVDVTQVEFLSMTEEEITGYVETGEPMDKAGAYALQGVGGLYVKRVDGNPFTVIGMPIHLLPRLVAAVGADLAAFTTRRPG